jgi:sec-independent protein translocase protein TatA
MTPAHLIVILVVALLVLGPKRLPWVGRGLGSAMRGFKDAVSGPSRLFIAPPPERAA